jgi:hypothetical protein
MAHVVSATSLNLRSAPRVAPNTRVATLPQGHRVDKVADAATGWWKVRTTLNGTALVGFVASQHLTDDADAAPAPSTAPAVPAVPAVHLQENRPDIKRSTTSGRAYPLGEPDRPQRSGPSAQDRVRQLNEIVRYLNVETHARYQKTTKTTFCNIYACDFCYLAGVYLPRVWWTPKALVDLAAGKAVAAKYGDTVRELNANALHDWFEDFGGQFGWRRATDLDEVQSAANAGGVGIIVAQRKELNQSGHIAVVVPEGATASARRTAARVHLPLQSQAGLKNSCYSCGTSRWWTGDQFRSFGLWIHD